MLPGGEAHIKMTPHRLSDRVDAMMVEEEQCLRSLYLLRGTGSELHIAMIDIILRSLAALDMAAPVFLFGIEVARTTAACQFSSEQTSKHVAG